ncbi:MAG TPA: 30S ribosomal protein S6 [bacterium]|nr:30S ribosomal protein S6 [bacterium]
MSMEKELKHYELMYIVPAKFAGEELESIKNKISDLLTGNGAEITKTQEMGRLRLAYPIKGVFQGFYYVLEFNAEPVKVRKVESLLRIMPEVLRYLLINKRVLTERELEAESRLNAAVEAEMRAKGYREMPAEDVRPERAARKETVAEMVAEETVAPVIDPVSAEMNSDETIVEAVAEEVKEEKKTRKSKDKKISLDEMDNNLDDFISDDINKLL